MRRARRHKTETEYNKQRERVEHTNVNHKLNNNSILKRTLVRASHSTPPSPSLPPPLSPPPSVLLILFNFFACHLIFVAVIILWYFYASSLFFFSISFVHILVSNERSLAASTFHSFIFCLHFSCVAACAFRALTITILICAV